MVSLKPVVKTIYGKTGKNRTEIIKRRLEQAFDEHPGVTNKDVADHCGVSEQAVWKWRRQGKIQRDHIPLLENYFKYPPGWLLDNLHEAREPAIPFIISNQVEREIVGAMRNLPPELVEEIKRHIIFLSKACAKK